MHVHGHAHDHRRSADRRALAAALALVTAFSLVEVAGGLAAGSLALLADAAHMASDASALALALAASWLAGRPATPERSFGYRRAEILAALANGVALVVLAIWILVEAIGRLGEPGEVLGGWMLAVGAVGLVVNVAAALVLARAGRESLNVRAALAHVLADLAGSVGVVGAAAAVLAGWTRADAVVSIGIAGLVVWSASGVLRESLQVLLEGAPAGIDAAEVGRAMSAAPGVVGVHDLHIWTITSGFPSLSAHVLVAAGADCHAVRAELERMLHERFGLDHTTLQVEHAQGLLTIER